MIGVAMLIAASSLSPSGQPRINSGEGPPDRYLRDEVDTITGEHLCDRRLSRQLRRAFDRRYARRLTAVHEKLVAIFGAEKMGRDVITISSCGAFAASGRRARMRDYDRRRIEFDSELSVWETYVSMQQRG